LSAKLMQTFADKGCHVLNVTDPYCQIQGFLDRSHYFFLQVAPQLFSPGWSPFQTDYFSESLVARGI
jgi:hypothetical protein